MSRWFVFDQPTADAVYARGRVQAKLTRESVPVSEMLDVAVNSTAALAVIAADHAGDAVLVRISRPERLPQPAAVRAQQNLAPAGFLGLSDTIDMDSEPEKPKTWWRRLLD